jgi:hypothetical protein
MHLGFRDILLLRDVARERGSDIVAATYCAAASASDAARTHWQHAVSMVWSGSSASGTLHGCAVSAFHPPVASNPSERCWSTWRPAATDDGVSASRIDAMPHRGCRKTSRMSA